VSARLCLTARQAREWYRIDPRLLAIVTDIVLPLWPEPWAVVTSLARTWEEDRELGGTGVHASGPPWRAIDLRTNGWDDPRVRDIAVQVNIEWQYDPERPHKPCALYTEHGTGPHLHLQVHPRTQRRMRHV